VIAEAEADALIAAHELTAKVIRVDDFAQDLGASEERIGALDAHATGGIDLSPAPATKQRAAA